ncbi:low molecular weight protein-tyrosine-phosphatase [Marinomonas mediterranea]|uniref:low molecular weight protein-tyrosine-phosphatase n=1 Tax=Marinomonas mediterranea TaxID=119864 RepID=UPI00234BED98|nr:low molecular weight protein-tyrosine-phosphatase [Marinomonas mediterranea]WCN09216.1 low molecular weight phosphotyrosine protein phosphatase [Marinomonas mediterranea]
MKLLTVCLGNICRSPAAQGIIENVAQERGINVTVDSAGTAAYHIGKSPDRRSINELRSVGIDLSQQRARQVVEADFYQYDWILAMDASNLQNLKAIMPDDASAQVVMFGEFAEHVRLGEVEDPYYGDDSSFHSMRLHLTEIAESFFDSIYSAS